jgi:hypothetical protein
MSRSTSPSVFQIANSRGTVWPHAKPNFERAGVYLLLEADKPGASGRVDTPPGTLRAKDITIGIGLGDNEVQEAQTYLMIVEDSRLPLPKRRFHNPTVLNRGGRHKIACYELTELGQGWAQGLLEDYERGFKRWLLDWQRR